MQIGPYRIVAEVGRGAMGAVFRALAPDGREVAVKLLTVQSAAAVARFERERALLAELGDAEGFVPVLDAGSSPAGPYLVSPFVVGGSLRRLLSEEAPLPLDRALALVTDLASAVALAHERGIVHRDLKPENVLLAPDGRPLVTDLGLAKHVDSGASASSTFGLSITGELRGTAGYMAPEQARDAKSAGPPADVFAIGAILHECLTGEPLFHGQGVLDVLALIESGDRSALRELRRTVPRWLLAVIERALAHDPASRYPSAGALADALAAGPPRRGALVFAAVLLIAALVTGLALAGPPLLARRAIERSRALARAGDADAALAEVGRAIELDPRSAVAYAERSDQRRRRSQLDEALEDAVRAVELDPRLAAAYAARGAARLARRDWKTGVADVTQAIELDPGLARAWANRATGRLILGDKAGALADATRAIELDPTIHQAFEVRARLRLESGADEEAIADATRAIELNPATVSAYSVRGVARARTRKTDLALEDLGVALARNPRDAIARRMRATLNRKRDPRGALADYDAAIEVDPNDHSGWVFRGLVKVDLGDLRGGIVDLDEALARPGISDALLVEALTNRGGAKRQLCDAAGARADFDRAIATSPKAARALRLRGELRREAGDAAGAIEDFDRFLALEPNDGATLNSRGTCHAMRRDFARAIADLDRAVELGMGWLPLFNRATAKLNAKDLPGALADATRTTELAPPDASVWGLLARVRRATGDRAGAIAAYDKALELAPRNETLQSERAELRAQLDRPTR